MHRVLEWMTTSRAATLPHGDIPPDTYHVVVYPVQPSKITVTFYSNTPFTETGLYE